jgi:hypothetical protein
MIRSVLTLSLVGHVVVSVSRSNAVSYPAPKNQKNLARHENWKRCLICTTSQKRRTTQTMNREKST